MLSLLVISFFALYYIRPAEWVPGIIGAPFVLVVGVISVLYLGIGVITRKYPNMYTGLTERMMFGYTISIALSHLSHFYIMGSLNALNSFLPNITGFFLVICFIDNRKRLRIFLLLLIILTVYLAYEGWLQHTSGFAHGGLEPVFDNKILADGETVKIPRIRWYGVFNDPNDLGLALVLVVPFLLDMLFKRRFIGPLVTIPLIAMAIYYTNSRGTILAGLVAIGSYFVIRYRSIYGAMTGGLLAIILFLFGPSRMSSVSDASSHGRIEAWYGAYQMFKANPLLGVGHGMFTEFNILTAHNSFVLVMAELGFVGLFFFTGVFYSAYYWLYTNIYKSENKILTNEDFGLLSAAYASMNAVLTAMFFLSRSYVLLPFMLIALVTAVTRVVSLDPQITCAAPSEPPKHFRNILLLTILQIIGINIVVKLFI